MKTALIALALVAVAVAWTPQCAQGCFRCDGTCLNYDADNSVFEHPLQYLGHPVLEQVWVTEQHGYHNSYLKYWVEAQDETHTVVFRANESCTTLGTFDFDTTTAVPSLNCITNERPGYQGVTLNIAYKDCNRFVKVVSHPMTNPDTDADHTAPRMCKVNCWRARTPHECPFAYSH